MQKALSISRSLGFAALLLAAVLCAGRCQAIDITATGAWSLLNDAGDLVFGAGSDLISDQESAQDQVALTIADTTGDTDNWRVDARRSDTNWPVGLSIFVKRTSDGAGTGNISGGSAYQEVTVSDGSFFSGSGNRNGIGMQLKLSGASVGIAPDTYSTSIVYTVVDTS